MSYYYSGPTVSVKLFIDKEKQRVLFAESDKDFADVLFSFLTLPLGTIVSRLGYRSDVGCLDALRRSVEALGIEHFQTMSCQNMLRYPRKAAASECEQLRVNIDLTDTGAAYVCTNLSCYDRSFWSLLPDPDVVCKSCKGALNMRELPRNEPGAAVGCRKDGVFVKSGVKLIITDDLRVAPASTSLVFSLMDEFGLKEQDQPNIEEKVLALDSTKIISLLKRSLLTKQPLTGQSFDVAITLENLNLDQPLPEQATKSKNEYAIAIKIKLIHTADDSTALYAEVGSDFVDLVFGLLAVPLGSIVNAFGHWPSNGCIANLYGSIDGSAGDCMKRECRSLLISPNLAPFFGCSIAKKVLQVEELDCNAKRPYVKCFKCYKDYKIKNCRCQGPLGMSLVEVNPKCSGVNDSGPSYLKGAPRNFIVTNDLQIMHFSVANTLQVLRAAKIPKEKLVEKELTLDKTKVLKLLRAAIATREALSSVLLSSTNKKRYPHH